MEQLFSPLMLLLLAFAYLLGSVPVAFLVARKFSPHEPQNISPHNFATENIFEFLGIKLSVVIFILNVLKGMIAIFAVQSFHFDLTLQSLAGLFAIIGHCFPIWLRYYGGKGLSIGFGVLLALSFWVAVCATLIFAIAFLLTRILSLSALLAALTAFMTSVIAHSDKQFSFIILLGVLLIFSRHHQNIRRILAGDESRFF